MWPVNAPSAGALETAGLSYTTYQSFGGSPDLPTEESQVISSGIVQAIDFDWGGGVVLDSGLWDGVTVKFEGWITPPEAKTYYMCAYTDDGFQLYLDGQLVIPDWWDRGPSCGNTADVDFSDGMPKQLLAYYYENGGGAVAQLMYFTDAGNWEVVPESWYTSEPIPTTTTTTTTTTLPEETTTTVEETTTTVEETTTTVEETTTTQSPPPPPTTIEETTTTTDSPKPKPTDPPSTPPPSEPEQTEAPNTSVTEDTQAPENTAPETTPETSPETPEVPSEPSVTPPPPSTPPDDVIEPETPPVEEPATIEDQTTEQIVENIESIEVTNLTTEEISKVFSSDVLESLSDDQVKELISSIDPSSLTDEQAEAIAEQLSDAPENVKKEFESQINIFGGQFDSYVPTGSVITVGQRRVIVAVAAVTMIAPVPGMSSRRK